MPEPRPSVPFVKAASTPSRRSGTLSPVYGKTELAGGEQRLDRATANPDPGRDR